MCKESKALIFHRGPINNSTYILTTHRVSQNEYPAANMLSVKSDHLIDRVSNRVKMVSPGTSKIKSARAKVTPLLAILNPVDAERLGWILSGRPPMSDKNFKLLKREAT